MIELNDFSREFTNDALDITGRQVVDCDGHEVGCVDSMFVDAFQRKVRFVGLKVADGTYRALIPVDAITQLDANRIVIEQTRGRVLDSPEYGPEAASAPREEYWVRLCEHYGYRPHWAADNIFPGYPDG